MWTFVVAVVGMGLFYLDAKVTAKITAEEAKSGSSTQHKGP